MNIQQFRLQGLRFLLVCLVAVGSKGHAGQQSFKVSAGLDGFNDSNYGLRTESSDSAVGSRQRVQMAVARETEISTAEFSTEYVDTYLDGSDADEADYLDLTGGYSRKLETSAWQLELGVRNDTTLADELLVSGPETIDVDRNRYSSSLNGQYRIDELWSLQTGLSFQKVDFEEQASGLLEYEYYAFNVQPTFAYSINNAVYLSVFASVVDYKDKGFEDVEPGRLSQTFSTGNESHGVSVGWQYHFSETLASNFSVGYRQSKYESETLIPFVELVAEDEEEGEGLVVNGQIDYRGERGETSFIVTQETRPNSIGDLIDQSSLRWLSNYQLSEVTRLALDAQLKRQRSDLESQMENDLDSSRLKIYAVWRITRNVRLQGGYRYQYRDFVETDESAESHLVEVGIRWYMDPITN
ncbi:MAG: hypothetical protein MI867_06785 [Pseudomonadales bacterium]|nr:hypothetical protein [Pseudomonadales bacterium]